MPHQYPDAAAWDERYRGRALWSGEPNQYLVSEVSGLAPGTALDAGCGEGADAIWLAGRGWLVTAVDFSAVALERAAAHARQRGTEIADRITWAHQNLDSWDPGDHRYDLVSACYLHLPSATRQSVFARLRGAVAPGGTLLIVGHHAADLQAGIARPQDPDRYFTGEEVTAALEQGQWDIVTNATVARTVNRPDNEAFTVYDIIFRASRHVAA